jgi:hypothetical protein
VCIMRITYFSFIQIFLYLHKRKRLTTQATTATSPMSGGPWATEEGTYNASESEPVCTRV